MTSTGDARAHTLARHRDILLEFTQARTHTVVHGRLLRSMPSDTAVQEYRRLKNNIAASREHALLLGGASPCFRASTCRSFDLNAHWQVHALVMEMLHSQGVCCLLYAPSAGSSHRLAHLILAKYFRIQVQGGSTAQLLRERGYLHSSTSQIDDVIGQAQAVRASCVQM